jgi:hypothetical protein
MRSHPLQIAFDLSRYGAAMLKMADIRAALMFFVHPRWRRTEKFASDLINNVFELQEPRDFIDSALYLGRSGLLSLVWMPLAYQVIQRRALKVAQFLDFEAELRILISS